MNSTELVHFVSTGERPRRKAVRNPLPAYYSELAGPVRHAILRARHFLMGEQQSDGSWRGEQTADATLPSQLILSCAYLGCEQTELAQQAAAAILDQQLPGGGWPLVPDGTVDLSTSVQAYFALKIVGLSPCDERLSRAREVIRRLGGADAADGTTRFFLALLGQVDYDCCPVIPLDLCSLDDRSRRDAAPLAAIWSLRPVRAVGIERGVRELFVNHPRDWPAARDAMTHVDGTQGGGRLRAWWTTARMLAARLWRQLEHHGWTPLRRRALDRAESRLLHGVSPQQIGALDFGELIGHIIALQAVGYDAKSPELRACEDQMHELVRIDEGADLARPQLRPSPLADTVLTLQSLSASGTTPDDPSIVVALEWLSYARRSGSRCDVAEIAGIVQFLRAAPTCRADAMDALPPDLHVRSPQSEGAPDSSHKTRGRLGRSQRIATSLVDRILRQQNPDGGWGPASAPDITGHVLAAIGDHDSAQVRTSVRRAVAYLRAAQRADGSWDSATGVRLIHGTAFAVRGLLAAGLAPDDDWVAAGLNWLALHQQPSGGWGELAVAARADAKTDNYLSGGATASQTAWALLALVAAGRANDVAARRGVEFLLETQEDDGRWREPHFVLRDARSRRWLRNELHIVAWPLSALSRWAVSAAAIQADGTDSIELRIVGSAADG